MGSPAPRATGCNPQPVFPAPVVRARTALCGWPQIPGRPSEPRVHRGTPRTSDECLTHRLVARIGTLHRLGCYSGCPAVGATATWTCLRRLSPPIGRAGTPLSNNSMSRSTSRPSTRAPGSSSPSQQCGFTWMHPLCSRPTGFDYNVRAAAPFLYLFDYSSLDVFMICTSVMATHTPC